MPKTNFDQLERLHWLIARGRAGPPAALAAQLGMAPRSLFRYLRALRQLGAPVVFCRCTGRYSYTAEWHLPEKVAGLADNQNSQLSNQ